MNRFRFEAFCKEFPGMVRVLEQSHEGKFNYYTRVDAIKVTRVDENFLKRVINESYHNGSLGMSEGWAELWAVMPNKEAVLVPTQNQYHRGSNYAHSQSEDRDGEPIIEAMVGLGEAGYFVLLVRNYSSWEGQQMEDDFQVAICKPSKTSSIAQEIIKARRQAHIEVITESTF